MLTIVSGFNEQSTSTEFINALRLLKIQLPEASQNSIREQHESSREMKNIFCSIVKWEDEYWSVTIMVNPTVAEALQEILQVVSNSYFCVYYGGHADENGNWILDNNNAFDDDDDDGLVASEETTLTFTEFHNIWKKFSSPGELYLNCCYSQQWEVQSRRLSDRRLSSVGLNLRVNDGRSLDENGTFYIGQLRCLYCYDDLVPVVDRINSISVEIRNKSKNLPAATDAPYDAIQFGFRTFEELVACGGDPPAHTTAVYAFPNKKSGDCYLISTDLGRCNILIDGNHYEHFIPHWKSVIGKIAKLDLVIGTHVDNDHVGGIDGLMRSPSVKNRVQTLWLNSPKPPPPRNPAIPGPTKVHVSKRNATKVHEIWGNAPDSLYPYRDITSGETKTIGDTTVEVLLPSKTSLGTDRLIALPGPINELSIVTVITFKNNAQTVNMLFTGDGSFDKICKALTVKFPDGIIFDLVTLPHHGSVSSNYSPAPVGKSTQIKPGGVWFHRRVQSKRYVLTGNWKSLIGNDSHPSKQLCNDLDAMITERGDFDVYLCHAIYKIAEYFPVNYGSARIIVPTADVAYLSAVIVP